jgi:hypothetical protein
MKIDCAVFAFGVVVFLVGTAGFLIAYAAAAMDQAEHEHTALARLAIRLCRALGLMEPPSSKGGTTGGAKA